MSPQSLVDTAESIGVRLWVEAGRLRYRGPGGADTDAILAEVKANRENVLALLSDRTGWMAGDPALVELLRLGIDEVAAYVGVERRAILDASGVVRPVRP